MDPMVKIFLPPLEKSTVEPPGKILAMCNSAREFGHSEHKQSKRF